MWFASASGQTDVVRALVSAGADVNSQRNDGSSALDVASQEVHIDVVNILLDNGAQIESRDNDGRTPLWFAAANGQTDVVRALVSAGADVNTQRNDGSSALDFASHEGHIDVVNILLDNGAQIEIRDNVGCTPLLDAAMNGQTDVVRALVSAGADVNTQRNDGRSALFCASQYGHIDVVNVMLYNFADINSRNNDGRTPLWFAAANGHSDVLRALVLVGAYMYDMDFENVLPVDIASYNGHIDIAQFLTSCNGPVMALRCSNIHRHSAVDVDCRRNTAMHLTAYLQAVISLLENGADVEAENIDGLRPIHCAVRTGRVKLVELLINHGANFDAADVFGNRPLHEAVCNSLSVVQLLVQRGANLNVQDINGKTPLHVAVERQQSDVIMFLLSQDADVGLTDIWRNTPLHYLTSELFALSGAAGSVVKLLRKKSQHLFIRNVVDVSASMHITTLALSNEHMTQAHKVNVYSREKLDADCYGNTPLHHVVGVYGRLKMYRISTDITKTVDFLVKRGANINAQNVDGLTPLHVARGEQAIKACLQHAGDQSFTITDKRGRNFWHLLFITGTQNETELGKTIQPMIATSDAKHSVDNLNRTPLHYACMDRNPCLAHFSWLAKEFIEQYNCEHINKRDRFGRTALHYAAIGGKHELKNLLKTMKADDTIQDNYQKTSNEYSVIRDKFDMQMSQLRLTKSSSFIARHRRDMSACVQNCFADNSDIVEETKLHKTLEELSGFHDKASYVLNVWHGCLYNYRDVTNRKSVAPEKGDGQQVHKQDCVSNNNKSIPEPTTMLTAIQTHVKNAMDELAKAITEHDRHRFACEVIPVGSAHEGTKIGCCDEFDYNFVLTNLSSICKVCYSPESPPGFVLLKASTPVYDEYLKDLFDQNGILNTRIVKFKFETLATQVLSSATFCDRTGFEYTDPVSTAYLGPPPGNAAAKLHMQIELTFTKPVNECHVPHAISVDIVPALLINDWWPDNARKKELCRTGDCLIVFTQPQIKYPWIGWTEPHGFISFDPAESRLLREISERHPVVKAAYMVVKRMSKYFCHHQFFSSHVIKLALLWCLGKEDLKKYWSCNGSSEVNGDELLCLVQNILRQLMCFAAQDYVPDYFMPSCHQPVYLSERYLKEVHMRLYQHGLTYKDLFSLSEQQSHDEDLQSIKALFTFSHVMYWTVLSETDDLKLFVPSTINSLCEISYNSDE